MSGGAPSEPQAPPPAPLGLRARRAIPVALFVGLLGLYHANGEFFPIGDAIPNLYGPVVLLRHGSFAFRPRQVPRIFLWKMRTPSGEREVEVFRLDERDAQGRTMGERLDRGELVLDQLPYYLVATRRPDAYAGIYGPGATLVAVPFFGAMMACGADLESNPRLLWYGGKLLAAALTSASAVLLYLTASRFVAPAKALLIAVSFGLGTCAWSMNSQALWQQTPAIFFLSLAFWFFVRLGDGRWWSAAAGLAMGMAAVCRPTEIIPVAAAAAYLGITNRRALAPFVAGAAGPGLFLAAYNICYFGSPVSLGQAAAATALAAVKTGSAATWQTPPWVGIPGLLVSPSRGLFVYSPFLVFSAFGAVLCWRSPAHRWLRPVSVAAGGLVLVASAWFDWWGGHSFGYRILSDALPLLCLLLIPVVDKVLADPRLRLAYGFSVALSGTIHLLGFLVYDLDGWDGRSTYFVSLPGEPRVIRTDRREEAISISRAHRGSHILESPVDVDEPESRGRLWSLSDSQIPYYLAHFSEAWAQKRQQIARRLASRPP